jgi:glycyl-tRNA synthetase
MDDLMSKVISLCKRRGFVYPNSEIYGGLTSAYDYGPLGVELLMNIKARWWQRFVRGREDIYGIDGAIISNPRVWEASGHVASFGDVLIDCRECKERFRADHLIFEQIGRNMEGHSLEEIAKVIREEKIKCPRCQKSNFTEPRKFNTLFKSRLGSVEDSKSTVYLRGETAQNMFLCYKNIVDSFSPQLPFGIAQIGKAFRNEVTLGNFIFRTFEFEQMEIEYFLRQSEWEKHYENWKELMWQWLLDLGVSESKLRWRRHSQEELSHYSKRTEDIEYDFPFGGFKELYGLAYRTDFDLKNHAKFSGQELAYVDPKSGEKFVPHVVEPTFGVNRTALVVLIDAYCQQGERVVLKIDPGLSPYKVAVFPLLANKPELIAKAREVYRSLKSKFTVAWDARGNIGKRYYSQDEIGTPYCLTIDFETLENNDLTVRERDSANQIRVKLDRLEETLKKLLGKKINFDEAGRPLK